MFHLCSFLSSHDSAAHLRSKGPRRRRRPQLEHTRALPLRALVDPRQHRTLGHIPAARMDRRSARRPDAAALLGLRGGRAAEAAPNGGAGAEGTDPQIALVRSDGIQAGGATSQMTLAIAAQCASNLRRPRRTCTSTRKNDLTPHFSLEGLLWANFRQANVRGRRSPKRRSQGRRSTRSAGTRIRLPVIRGVPMFGTGQNARLGAGSTEHFPLSVELIMRMVRVAVRSTRLMP